MKKKSTKKIMWFESFFIIANLLIIILFYKNIPLATILLSIVAVIGLIKWNSLRTLYIFLLAGIGGTILEIISIYAGVWEYSITNFLNVPFWLFIVWGNAGAIIYQVSKKIKEGKIEKNDRKKD